MLRNAPDHELKELMRQLAKVAGLNLTEDRIENDLPQFRVQLGWIETLDSFHVALESEPSPATRLEPRRKDTK